MQRLGNITVLRGAEAEAVAGPAVELLGEPGAVLVGARGEARALGVAPADKTVEVRDRPALLGTVGLGEVEAGRQRPLEPALPRHLADPSPR